MNLWQLAATFFYLGKIPFAPGSFGSLCILLIWFFLPLSFSLQLIIIIFFFTLGVISSKKVSIEMNNHDPAEIVIDEAVGMGISLFMLPHDFTLFILAFILFRIFDIFKPSFIYHIQNISGGWGIMLDDVFAGIITLTICHGIHSFL